MQNVFLPKMVIADRKNASPGDPKLEVARTRLALGRNNKGWASKTIISAVTSKNDTNAKKFFRFPPTKSAKQLNLLCPSKFCKIVKTKQKSNSCQFHQSNANLKLIDKVWSSEHFNQENDHAWDKVSQNNCNTMKKSKPSNKQKMIATTNETNEGQSASALDISTFGQNLSKQVLKKTKHRLEISSPRSSLPCQRFSDLRRIFHKVCSSCPSNSF